MAKFSVPLLEPSDNRFDFCWLRNVVKLLDARGVSTVLGTPSPAPPQWLSAAHPEALIVGANGQRVPPASRRFNCPTNRIYRDLANRIAGQITAAFGRGRLGGCDRHHLKPVPQWQGDLCWR